VEHSVRINQRTEGRAKKGKKNEARPSVSRGAPDSGRKGILVGKKRKGRDREKKKKKRIVISVQGKKAQKIKAGRKNCVKDGHQAKPGTSGKWEKKE